MSGYKLTEVGLIPEEWEVKRLGECLASTPRYGINAAAVPYSDRLPVYIRITDISTDGRFSPEKLVSVDNTQASNYYLLDGDIVLARTGASVGKSYKYDTSDGPLVFAGFLILIRPNPTKLVSGYISSYLSTKKYWDWVGLMSMRSGQPGINGKEYSQLPLPIPSISEQREISITLFDIDYLIKNLDKIIAKKRDIQQAVMQQLLTGQRRLPGFSGEWEMKRLGDVGELISGGTPKTSNPEYWGGHIKWCTPTDITRSKGKYLSETERNISEAGLADSGARLLPAGSLLICTRATIGELKIARTPLCTNQGFKSLICHDDISQEFMYYKLLTMKKDMIERAFGSTFLEISKANISAITFSVPPQAEQKAIATILSDMDTELAALEARRDKARHIKQGVMQELLTGRTRLI